MARRPKGGGPAQRKMMVIDCKNDSQWAAIHSPTVNGVVLRRRPIRAIETYLDNVEIEPIEFKASQSQLRKKLEKLLPLNSEDDELRRKFLINDIAAMARIMIAQAKSRDYLFNLGPELPTDFQTYPGALKMIVTYRGRKIFFRQPKDKDVRYFEPYGSALFRGQGYESPVEWYSATTGDSAFYLTIEPAMRGRYR
jgi:hypothetical protein